MADGLIYQRYKANEIAKAVDVVIDELTPSIPETVPNVVSVEDLAVANNTINELQAQAKLLTNQMMQLTDKLTASQTQSETDKNAKLSVEQENIIVSNQLDALSNVINQLTEQLSVALQKSIDESVMRTSLHAANQGYKAQIEAYIKQIDTLNNLIFGLQAQLGAIQEQRVLEQSNFQQQILLAQQQLATSQQSLTQTELQLLALQNQQTQLNSAATVTNTTNTAQVTNVTTVAAANTITTNTATTNTVVAPTTSNTSIQLPAGEAIGPAIVTFGKFDYNGSTKQLRSPLYGRFKGSKPDGTWNTTFDNNVTPYAVWGNGDSISVFNNSAAAITVNITPQFGGKNAFTGKTPNWYTVSQTLATLQPNETKKFTLTLNWAETKGMDSREQNGLFGSTFTSSKTYFDGDLILKITPATGIAVTKNYKTEYEVLHPSSY